MAVLMGRTVRRELVGIRDDSAEHVLAYRYSTYSAFSVIAQRVRNEIRGTIENQLESQFVSRLITRTTQEG